MEFDLEEIIPDKYLVLIGFLERLLGKDEFETIRGGLRYDRKLAKDTCI